MKTLSLNNSRPKLNNMLRRSVFIGVIASVSFLSSTLIFSSKSYAQAAPVKNDEVIKYAKTVLEMEPSRQQTFDEIKKMMGGSQVPQISCNDSNSFNGLPGKAKNIAVEYCNRYLQVVTENGLSMDRFNEITVQIQGNQNLQQQVHNQLLRLQKKP